MWTYRGQQRPPFAVEPGPGQESVWDYPRPPHIAPDERPVEVRSGEWVIARTSRAVRVLETASPPTFYVPREDVDMSRLVAAPGSTFCEWKGVASYWALAAAPRGQPVAWSYESPSAPFAPIRGWLAFYPSRVACFVAGKRVRPQKSEFYGGWVTDEIVGPFKGEPGTSGW